LSGGQQQRLCLARTLAVRPEVLLMDEPCSALDPRATAIIEELTRELVRDFTIVIVTHNIAQASRIADHCAFMLDGKLVMAGNRNDMLVAPTHPVVRDFITGKIG
jgi:phosphate transport system ATP-binding protein